MAHVVDETPPVKSRLGLLWGVALVAAVVLILIEAIIFASNAGSGASAAARGAYWQGTVGEQEEVKIHLPPRSWFDLEIDKPVIIRLADGQRFWRGVNGSIFKVGADGRGTLVTTIGDTIPGSVIYLSALKGEKMAKVTITVVRKAREEVTTVPTPTTPPAAKPSAPPSGATQLPPAKPISPKSGIV